MAEFMLATATDPYSAPILSDKPPLSRLDTASFKHTKVAGVPKHTSNNSKYVEVEAKSDGSQKRQRFVLTDPVAFRYIKDKDSSQKFELKEHPGI